MLIAAYRETIYHTYSPALNIKIDQENEDLTVFLFDNNAYTWAFVSASNPYSIKISDQENQQNHKTLLEWVQKQGYRFLEGEGKHPHEDWLEKSVLILDISKKDAVELGEKFKQNAIVFGYFNKAPELIFCTNSENTNQKKD